MVDLKKKSAENSSAADFRLQLKATPIKKLKKKIDEDNVLIGSRSNEYLQLEDGKTLKIRIFPAHPGGESFYVAKKCYWLSFDGNDGEKRRGTVLDSKAHAGTKLDVVEEFAKFARSKWAKDADRLDAINGNNKDNNGLGYSLSWVCYADVIREGEELRAKVWEMKKSVRDAINGLSFNEGEDEVIEDDPFTDPDEGLPIAVKFLRKPDSRKGEKYYDVKFPMKVKPRPLTDEEIEYFMTLTPLADVVGKYGMRQFERALEGLQNFDEEHELEMFEDEEWLEKVEEIKAQYEEEDEEDESSKKKSTKKTVKKVEEADEDEDEDEDEEEDEEEEKPAPKKQTKKKVEEPEEDEEESDDEDEESDEDAEGDELDDMDRSELKKYIVENGLSVSIKKSMSDDDLRDAIRAAAAEESEDEDEEEDDEPTKSKTSLSDLKARLTGKKK